MKLTPAMIFNILNITGLSLMFVNWLQVVDTEGFLLLSFLVVMCVARNRFDHSHRNKTIFTIIFITMAIPFFIMDNSMAEFALNFVLFQCMYWGFYIVALVIGYLPFVMASPSLLITISVTFIGLILNFWSKERDNRFKQRDYFSKKNYELESLKNELTIALAQVEQLSIIAERTRISSEIHDNVGHEVIASFITFQTVRKIIEKNPKKALELFDESMNRLSIGVGKMRDAVHNMSAITFIGVDRMREICQNYSNTAVTFMTSGDMTGVTTNIWHILEAVLNESLTNVIKHSKATFVRVELDATKHLVRLFIENDGVIDVSYPIGSGLRNLRYRVVTVGGDLTVNKDETFRMVCVIPIN